MKVRLSKIVYDTVVDGILEHPVNLPTEVIIEIEDFYFIDIPPTSDYVNELALEAHARNHDWLIETCNVDVI